MKFVVEPSLERMALVKIGITLFNPNDIRALISKLTYYRDLYLYEWQIIEERVIDKVPQLSLPHLLKEKVFGVIKPIGIQIFKWMRHYCKYNKRVEYRPMNPELVFPAQLLADLYWAPQGTVDRKRTIEVLVKNENLDIFTRYRLACDYCLEDDIVRIWNRLSENLKEYDWDNFPVNSFWSNNMKQGGTSHITYKDEFYFSVHSGKKVAAKYFLQKLTPQEKEECLNELIEDLEDANALYFLLPELEKEQQMLIFKRDPYGVLYYFLQWPFQSFFIEVANCMWGFLSKDSYDDILKAVINKVREGWKDYNYQKLFREFWQKSPSALKDSAIEEIDRSSLILLFDIRDKENIRLILKDATPTAKAKIIYSNKICCYLTHSICENEWDFLEFCIRECLPSKKEMLNFKDEFEKCLYFKVCSEREKHKWNEMFQFFDDSICKYGKRSIEGESSSSERFQILH